MGAGQLLEVAADHRGLLQFLRDHTQLGEQVGDGDTLPPRERLGRGGSGDRQQRQQQDHCRALVRTASRRSEAALLAR